MSFDAALKNWTHQRIKPDEIDRYLDQGRDFIDDAAIWKKIETAREPDAETVRAILTRSLAVQTLTPEELATLMRVQDPEMLREMENAAFQIKKNTKVGMRVIPTNNTRIGEP